MTGIVVITAGLRQPSSSRMLADRLAAATDEALGGGTRIDFVELREYARDLTNHLLTGFPSGRLSELLERTRTADALIAVSPIFSGSYSGLFKTFFDVLEPDSLGGKPVLIGATGGTARHSLVLEHALRPLFSYLQAVVVPTGVYAAPEDWGTADALASRIGRAAGQLAALLSQRRPEFVEGRSFDPSTLRPLDPSTLRPFDKLRTQAQDRPSSGQRLHLRTRPFDRLRTPPTRSPTSRRCSPARSGRAH